MSHHHDKPDIDLLATLNGDWRAHARYAQVAGHWLMAERTGLVLADSSVYRHESTLNANAVLVPGRRGYCVQLDGVDDHVITADPGTFDLSGDLTISFWVYWLTVEHDVVPFDKSGGGAASFSIILNDVAGTVFYRWYHHESGGNFTSIFDFTDFPVPAQTWHHVLFCRRNDTKTITLFIDGREVETVTWGTDDPGPTTASLYWGNTTLLQPGRYAHCRMDDVRIYTRAVSQQEAYSLARFEYLEFNESAALLLRQAPLKKSTVIHSLLIDAPAVTTTPAVDASLARSLDIDAPSITSTPAIDATLAHLLTIDTPAITTTPDIDMSISGIIMLRIDSPAVTSTPAVDATQTRDLDIDAPALTTTPDIDMSVATAIELAIDTPAVTTTSDAEATLVRSLDIDAPAKAATPDIDMSVSGLIQLTIDAPAVSTTPDIDATQGRQLTLDTPAVTVTAPADLTVAGLINLRIDTPAVSTTPDAQGTVARSLDIDAPAKVFTPDIDMMASSSIVITVDAPAAVMTPDIEPSLVLGLIVDAPGVTVTSVVDPSLLSYLIMDMPGPTTTPDIDMVISEATPIVNPFVRSITTRKTIRHLYRPVAP